MSSTPTGELLVGVVIRAHGLRGEVVVDVRTDYPEQRFVEGAVLTARRANLPTGTLTVAAARPHSGRLLVTFEQTVGRDAAEALRGTVLLVSGDELPHADEGDDDDTFHDTQLEGLTVVLADGTVIGTLREVAHGPGSDLLVVSRAGRPDALVPFVRDIVPTVDIERRTIVLTPPEGLLD